MCIRDSWHLADIPTAAAFVRYWTNNGQRRFLARDSLSAFDPTETIHVILPPSNDALRHCRLAGVLFAFGSGLVPQKKPRQLRRGVCSRWRIHGSQTQG